jgi:predicted RNA polymerase sigma factor
VTGDPRVEDLLRRLAPQVLAALVRRHGRFDTCEDAVQEALVAAVVQWPAEGLPENPKAWLVTVASRRLVDQVRSEHARRRREEASAAQVPADEHLAPAPATRPNRRRTTPSPSSSCAATRPCRPRPRSR